MYEDDFNIEEWKAKKREERQVAFTAQEHSAWRFFQRPKTRELFLSARKTWQPYYSRKHSPDFERKSAGLCRYVS